MIRGTAHLYIIQDSIDTASWGIAKSLLKIQGVFTGCVHGGHAIQSSYSNETQVI